VSVGPIPTRAGARLSIFRVGRLLGGLLVAGLLVLGYAHFVEPVWIEVTHLEIRAPAQRRLKIAHLSDLHSHGLGRTERRMLELLATERPDVIVITGDNAPNDGDPSGANSVLAELHAPLGVYMVLGNWDHWRPRTTPPANVRILNNENARLLDSVFLVGVDDNLSGRPDLYSAVDGIPPGAYRIGLFHTPDFFDRAAADVQLALAGHTHGGQVRLPGLGALWLPPGSGSYVQGWYERGSARMYVSRGIGSSIFPLRFLCRPELVIIELMPLGQ